MKRLISLACAVLLGASLFANTVITLKNGQVIEGEVYRVLDNGDLCVHKTDGNDILISLSDIASRTSNDKTLASESTAHLTGFGLKAAYVHGFNSKTVTDYYDWYNTGRLIAQMSNGNGISIGLSYTLNLGKHFYFEPALLFSVLHYDFESLYTRSITAYKYDGHSWLYGSELQLQFGYHTNISSSADWTVKLGPSLTSFRDFDEDYVNPQLGIQFDTGIKFHHHHYVGIGFNLCCLSGVNESYYDYYYEYVKANRHRLSLTYAYYF